MARTARIKGSRAPGRVNLIGEHTDYNDGFVLPIAIQLACEVQISATRKKDLVVKSVQAGEEHTFSVDDLAVAQPRKHWTDYVIGVAKELIAAGFPVQPARLTIDCTVPTGSGLSSSAALEVASALAMLNGRDIDSLELAKLCQRAERNFVGMPCGIMDQFVSVLGQEHAAIMIDCRSLEYKMVWLPDSIEIVAVNTMVKHELGGSAYASGWPNAPKRSRISPARQALRDVSFEELERTPPQDSRDPARARTPRHSREFARRAVP